MKKIRQQYFYDTLVALSENLPNEWWSKEQLVAKINGEYSNATGRVTQLYSLDNSPFAHDVCSLLNQDRLAINESLAFEKIILVKDNNFKIATLHEALAEEEIIRKRALKALWRQSLLRAKRLQDGQIIVDFEDNVEKVISTFGGK